MTCMIVCPVHVSMLAGVIPPVLMWPGLGSG